MATKPPNDLGTSASPDLSMFLDAMVNVPGRAQLTTLRDLRAALSETCMQWSNEPGLEIDALIARYGGATSAQKFVR